MQATLPEEVFRKLTCTIGLSANWNMFSMAESAPLTSGRTVSFIIGRRPSHTQVRGITEFETSLETLVARTGQPADDFSYGLHHAAVQKHSFRWMLYHTKLRDLGTDESRALTASSACSRAEALWRGGKLPGPPESVSIYEVYYDLPRERGQARIAEWAIEIEPRPASGLSSTRGWWTASATMDPLRTGHKVLWPRAVVAYGTTVWDCKHAKEVVGQVPITVALVSYHQIQRILCTILDLQRRKMLPPGRRRWWARGVDSIACRMRIGRHTAPAHIRGNGAGTCVPARRPPHRASSTCRRVEGDERSPGTSTSL